MSFTRKVAIVALFVIVLPVLRSTFSVLLMILAASFIIAHYFHGLAGLIERKFGLSRKLNMLLSIEGTFLLLVLFFWPVGSRIQSQIEKLSDQFPQMVEQAKNRLTEYSWGQPMV